MKGVGKHWNDYNTLGERDGDGFMTWELKCVNADDPR